MRRAVILVVVLYVVVYVAFLGVRPLTSPDETRYAEVPREMIASGDWVVPRLDGVLYFEKPPLGYWLVALSISAFGENNFAVRFTSAISVGLTAWILFLLVLRLSGRSRVALLAAVVYLTSLLVVAIGSIALLDSLLTLFLTGTLAAFLGALHETRSRQRAWLLGLAGLCGGLAFLTKGFLAFAVPGMVAAAWIVLERRIRDAPRLAWLPLLTAFAVALPWSVGIHLREPDFWRYFFWVEHVDRFLDPRGPNQHPEPFWFFVPILVGGIVPWLPLLPAALAGFRAERAWGFLARCSAAWFVLPFLFFSASSGKLPAYVLPCFPPLAILVALGLEAYVERQGRTFLFSAGSVVSALGALAGGVAVWGAGRSYFGAGETWKWILLAGALAGWGVVALAAAFGSRGRGRVWVYAAAPVLFLVALHLAYPRSVEPGHAYGRFLEAQASRVAPTSIVVTHAETVHAVCWNLKRSDVVLLAHGGELEYGLGRDEAAQRLLRVGDLLALLTAKSRARDVVIVVPEKVFESQLEGELARLAPSPAFRADGDGLVFLVYRAVVEARRASSLRERTRMPPSITSVSIRGRSSIRFHGRT